ncbi:MAG: endo-1,4-beta-xylanase [Planctomycetota bacterium]
MRFQVFKNGAAAEKFTLCGAYLFGTDGIAIRRAQIKCKNGVVTCEKPNLETAGLTLLWPVDGFGKVLLATTCLPEREDVYNLNLEIARAKLMQIVNKQEDWSYFDSLEGMEDLAKEARSLFIRAVQNISNAPAASELADESLKRATVLSERLAIKQADSFFEARGRSRGFSRGCLGCRVNPAQITNPKYIERLVELFGFVTVPVNWARVESSRGNYDFSRIDACINVLGKQKLAICVGPLLCFTKEYLPKWLLRGSVSFEKVREVAYKFVSRMVGRYSGSVHAWRVISGLNALNHFGFNFEQVLEMTRAANLAVRAVSSRAVKIVEISNPWGEYYATTPNTIPPLVYVDMVVQSGINFDAFGLQIRFGKNQAGMHVRDMMDVSAVLDYFGTAGKPLYVTDIEIPSQTSAGPFEGEVAGIWHDEWDEVRQAQWMDQFYKIALSKPFVDTVTYSNLADVKGSTIANSGLMTARYEPKESFRILKDLRGVIFNR